MAISIVTKQSSYIYWDILFKQLLCVFVFPRSLLHHGSQYECSGEGKHFESVSIKYLTKSAVVGEINRYVISHCYIFILIRNTYIKLSYYAFSFEKGLTFVLQSARLYMYVNMASGLYHMLY